MKYKICVSGAAAGDSLTPSTLKKAKKVGERIAQRDCVLITGATTGIPHYSAMGAHEENGISIGFSPGISKKEHVKKYRLPTDDMDLIVYTGFGYSGRNLLMVRSSEAVIIIGGRIGTLNEFTNAFEEEKPIGVLLETTGIADEIKRIVDIADKGSGDIIYDKDPVKLVDKIVHLLDKKHSEVLTY
jgi:hypothetical protein